MKQIIVSLSLSVLLLFSCTFFCLYAQVADKWTGTVQLSQKLTGPFIKINEKKIDVSIINNVVTDSVSYKGDHSITTEAGTAILKKNCSGKGQGTLNRVDISDGEYYVHIITHTYNCSSVTNEGTEIFTEESDITFSSTFFNSNHDVMAGSDTTTVDTGAGIATTITTWHLTRGPLDVELIISPVNYDIWLPKPGADELRKGNVMDIQLKVQKRNGQPASLRVESFELKLDSTSREPGITINMPLTPSASQLPDIRFLPTSIGESISEDQEISFPSPDGRTGTATIASYDGGGWTTLTAVAILENGFRIEGSLFTPRGVKRIPIPKRDPALHIATAWLTANGNPGETDDKESKPGNPNIGDGLTAYEEYRGVISEGEFTRLKPVDKELGVLVKRSEVNQFKKGTGLFQTASGVKIIHFDETEINTDRRLNKNFLTAHDYDQYVLKVENGSIPGSAVGMNEPIRRLRGIPKQTDRIVIDIQKINDNYRYDDSIARAGNEVVPFTNQEKLDNAVAHEIGHGVNLIHHGDEMGPYTTEAPKCTPTNPCYTIYRIYDHHNNEILERPIRLSNAGAVGSEESGDLSCIMAYTGMYQWAYRLIQGEHCYYYVPFLPVGKKLCTKATGTGINANNKYFGNAEDGNCLNQIKLRD